MKIRLKKRGMFGVKKVKLDGKIERIERGEGTNVFVRGLEGIGVVVFSPREVEMIVSKVKRKEVKEKKVKKRVKKKRGRKK